jgi:hypothetical protein
MRFFVIDGDQPLQRQNACLRSITSAEESRIAKLRPIHPVDPVRPRHVEYICVLTQYRDVASRRDKHDERQLS